MGKKPNLAEKLKAMSAASKPLEQKTAGHQEIAAVTRQTVEHETWEAAKPKPKPETVESPMAKASDLTAIARQTVEAMKGDTPPRTATEDRSPSSDKRDSVATLTRAHVSTSSSVEGEDVPRGFKVRRPRIEKPHQSVYAHPKVFDAIRAIAASEYPKKPQDLYREGLRHVLASRGYDFDKLDKGEG